MVWYSYLLKNFPQFVVIHTVKGFGIVNKAKIDDFLEHVSTNPKLLLSLTFTNANILNTKIASFIKSTSVSKNYYLTIFLVIVVKYVDIAKIL